MSHCIQIMNIIYDHRETNKQNSISITLRSSHDPNYFNKLGRWGGKRRSNWTKTKIKYIVALLD